jgi:ATP-binding cassette subfamily C (CFTR/MRP) protein 1
MFRALNKAYGRTFWIGGAYKAVNDILTFAGPVFLYLIVAFIQAEGTADAEPLWLGIVYATSLFVCSVVQSMAVNQYFHNSFRVGMQVTILFLVPLFVFVLFLVLVFVIVLTS